MSDPINSRKIRIFTVDNVLEPNLLVYGPLNLN